MKWCNYIILQFYAFRIKICNKICICQIKAVPLQRKSSLYS